MSTITKGFKVTDKDMKCRGFQYELNKEYHHKGKLEVCSNGFHFFELANSCFDYYEFNPTNRVFEVEASGSIITEGNKGYAANIKLIRELNWEEVLRIVNTGVGNSGRANSGNSNSGDSNSGNSNSGNWNSGNSNSGDSNSGYRNSGAFCADNNPKVYLFDKVSGMTVREWEGSKAFQIMSERLNFNIWVPESLMNDEEKKSFSTYKTTGGFLKKIEYKEGWANMWNNLTDANKKVFTDLPNFDAAIFETITGIKVETKAKESKKTKK